MLGGPYHFCLVLFAIALLPFQVAAQFGNFFQHAFNFGGQQQQQPQERGPVREQKGWNEFHSVSCRAGYVCPGSLACVPTPADCPCPYAEDYKCVIPDDRPRDEGEGPPFVCVRTKEDCADVVKFSQPI